MVWIAGQVKLERIIGGEHVCWVKAASRSREGREVILPEVRASSGAVALRYLILTKMHGGGEEGCWMHLWQIRKILCCRFLSISQLRPKDLF